MYLIQAYVTNASLNINRPFTYIYQNNIDRYTRIKVSFNNSLNVALVVDSTYTDKTKTELEEELGFKISEVIEVIDDNPIISDELYELAKWLSRTTVSPLISCLNAMLPKTLKTSKTYTNPRIVKKIKKNDINTSLTKRQKEVYDLLTDDMLIADARKISLGIVNKLIDLNILSVYEQELEYINESIDKSVFKTLTLDQQNAYDSIIKTDKVVSLLFGVTGSGKTEVYLHLARYYLSKNKQVLIMVPEISLTPQMIQRVKERFDDVIFYHSELSDQERYEQYKRVKQNEVKIVVGTRSSIFLPFNDLGIIIIDEEHDSSYKQDNIPCYQAKNVAIKRAYDQKCKVLLASATPSLDAYTYALNGKYQLLQLKDRINLNLPDIEIVDLSKQVRNKGSYIISNTLKDSIIDNLINNKQTIILLNRRGYSPIIKCSECNSTLMCSDCDIPLNYHKDENILKCHQCSRTYKMIDICPNCHNKSLIYYGFGTKRVEEEMHKLFPSARIERMDRDSVSKKGSHQMILDRFAKKEIDILIGTQMIAKGLDFPDVTLVGILNGDAGLMHQDFNSAKLTFDLLMQASGRSGRADSKGKVIIQAFNVDHYAIKAVLNHDYNYFYNIEMRYREKVSYPPFSHIIEIIVSDTNEDRLSRSLQFLSDRVNALPFKTYRPYQLAKIQRQHRYRLLLLDRDIIKLLDATHLIVSEYLENKNMSHIKIDVDPLYIE